MKNIFLILIISILLGACTQINSNADKKITNGVDTVADVDISFSKLDLVEELAAIDIPIVENKLIFKASGIEPGWFAEFSENKLRLVVEYGKDSVIVNQNFNDLTISNDFKLLKEVLLNNKPSSLLITINNKPCVNEASGNKEDCYVNVTLNKKNYKGCGSFIK